MGPNDGPPPENDAPREAPVVLFVRIDGDELVVSLIRAELRSYGWRIAEIRQRDEEIAPVPLSRLAADFHAAAAVRVDLRSAQVNVHIARSWGNVDETLHAKGDGDLSQILALRVTETLRAHGFDEGPEPFQRSQAALRKEADPINTPRAIKPDDTTPPGSRAREPSNAAARDALVPKVSPLNVDRSLGARRPALHSLWLDWAPAAITSAGGLGIQYGGLIGVRSEISQVWSLRVMGVLPLDSLKLRGVEGSATISVGMIAGSLEANWLKRSSVRSSWGLGMGALVVPMHGTAGSGYSASDTTVTVAAPQTSFRIATPLSTRIELFGYMLGGLTVPEVKVLFEQHEVARFGRPFALLSVGLDLRCFSW